MPKLSVVIADDDRLVLKDLRNMADWNKLGFSIVATATSGEEAIKYVNKYQPFLLITDICMMGMNGLDAIEIAHKKYPHMKFLIISSYDDFHYLKRAMASGVIDYLLKTDITPATLTQKLLDAKQQFSQDNRVNASIIAQEISHFLDTPEESGAAHAKCPPIEQFPALEPLKNNCYYFMLCSRNHFFSRNLADSLLEWRTHTERILQDVYQLALNYDVFPLICQYEQMLLVGLSHDMASHFALLDFSNTLQYRFGGATPFLQFYIDRPITLSEFRSFIHPLLPLIYYHLVFSPQQGRAVNLDQLAGLSFVPVLQDFPFHALIFDEEHLEKDILLIKSYIETCCQSYDIKMLAQFYQNFCLHLEIQTNNQLKLPDLLFADTPEMFQKWIYNRLSDCIQFLTRGMNHAFTPAVETAVRFIKQNYSRSDLTSADIADASGLSVNRLGILMKQDTGKTINEYLAQVRIEKAVELLEKTNLKIYEISERCGYKSSQYFSQVFYQKTGRKPIDYRKGRK